MQGTRLTALVAAGIAFAFGVLLLLLPDAALKLDELSVGNDQDARQTVTVETVTVTEDGIGGGTTTTETIRRNAIGNPLYRLFGSPAVLFLLRLLFIAAIAFLVGALVHRIAYARFTVKGGTPWLEIAELDRQDAIDAMEDLLAGTPRLRDKVEGMHEISKEKIRRGAPGLQVDRTLEDGTLLAGLPYPISNVFEDPNIAMSSFRIELEQRLRKLANARAIDPTLGLPMLLSEMTDDGIFEETAVKGFEGLVDLGDRAIRGTGVDHGIVEWVRQDGVPLLAALDWLAATPVDQEP